MTNNPTQKVVAVFDLDDTLVCSKKKGRFTNSHYIPPTSRRNGVKWYYDPMALQSIKQLLNNKHQVVVMTLGRYSYEDIISLFKLKNIMLLPENFHNYFDIENFNKAEYLDKQYFAKRAMLFDDDITNRTQNAFFQLVDSESPFMSFGGEQGTLI